MDEEVRICDCCGEAIHEGEEYSWVDDDIVCEDCRRNECGYCEDCDELIYDSQAITEDGHYICRCCYENDYYHCERCGMLLHRDSIYTYHDMDYCYDCYTSKNHTIREYAYKPEPIFYGKDKLFLGVELEIDEGGYDDDNALEIVEEANYDDERIFVKSDGSL